MQVPTDPGKEQLWQPDVQEVLQHTPSTQLPELHSQVLEQVLPSAFVAAQVPDDVQKLPLLQ